MGILGKLAQLFGIERKTASEAIVASAAASPDLTLAEMNVLRRRRMLEGARRRLAKAQAQVDGGDRSAVAVLKRWQHRVEQHEMLLEMAKRSLPHGH